MSDKQHTLKAKSEVKGVGLHTGEEVTLTLCPAPIGHGLKLSLIHISEPTRPY